ncbi:hypothetical protein [Nostoc sp.]
MPNAQCPMPNAQCPIIKPHHDVHRSSHSYVFPYYLRLLSNAGIWYCRRY